MAQLTPCTTLKPFQKSNFRDIYLFFAFLQQVELWQNPAIQPTAKRQRIFSLKLCFNKTA
jgi:hypothetical protein